jgi:hypothetical protein
MKKASILILTLSVLAFAEQISAQRPPTPTPLDNNEVDRIIAKFTQNEGAFREALTNYVFNRSATIQTIGMGGQVTGTYRRDSFMTFSSDGKRFEKITFFPVSTLREIGVTPEDLEDLGGVNPFALDPSAVSRYNISYKGTETIDEIEVYVFDVTPKTIPDPRRSKVRLFTGTVWVDTRDLMIVKSKGKGVPETKDNKFPVVTTWRENIDGKYWFPSYSSSDDTLEFGSGQVVRLRVRVRYDKYREAKTDVRILDDEEVVEEPKPKKP